MKLYAAALDFRSIAHDHAVRTEFSPELHRAAATAVDRLSDQRKDLRDLPFVTIDPEGSQDLDQALYLQEIDGGFRVHYAIADVMAFVPTGSPISDESFLRGQTIYLPDQPARLHPPELSEDRASLLPGVDRPAVVWTIDLDNAGEVTSFTLTRATVRSRAQLNYDSVQHSLNTTGTTHPSIALLPQVGALRQESSVRRNAINLSLPTARVEKTGDGRFALELEPRLPIHDWNSEISLLTGMVAGTMMAEAGIGILRSLGPAPPEAEATFIREVHTLGYQPGENISAFLTGVDATTPSGMAVMREAQKLLRGADYIDLQQQPAETHAGVGGYYAHVTAPLRRLPDRFATEICLQLVAGRTPDTTDIPEVVAAMRHTNGQAASVGRACLELMEERVLETAVGETFTAIVLDDARVMLDHPPVFGECTGNPPVGTRVSVILRAPKGPVFDYEG